MSRGLVVVTGGGSGIGAATVAQLARADFEVLATGRRRSALESVSAQSGCATQAVAPFFFEGQTPEMILSHYPITGTASYVLPSTGYRLAVLKA